MQYKFSSQFTWVGWLFLWPIILWLAVLFAQIYRPDQTIFEMADRALSDNLSLAAFTWNEYSLRSMVLFSIAYALGIGIYYSSRRNLRPKEEHGSAQWASTTSICKRYRDRDFGQNILLTEHFRIGFDSRRHLRNLNVLVVGGSGSGKTRYYAKPNLMQANCSFIVTDPKGELLRDTGHLLKTKGYDVKVFDLINMNQSFCYNPFQYIRDDKDVLKLVTNLIRNTTPKTAGNSDPFWEKSETALLQALMLYLYHEAPPEEQNFTMVMEMINSAEVREDDENFSSPLDLLFERLSMQNPDHIAVRQYGIYKQAAGKTAKSILISVGVRLAAFNLSQIASITQYDEMDLESLGQHKVSLFCVIPDNDSSFNYLVGMLYTQAFQSLYYLADHHYGGRLPMHVHAVMDEFANVALPNDFEKILSTMRSREISVSIIIQNLAQLKALFKDSWESIVGNCDEFLYLGGNEQSTHEYVSKLLGKATIDTNTYGKSQGKSGSYSTNYQQTGRELLTPDEVRLLDNNYALLFVRGERAMLDQKINLMKHPNLSLTTDGGYQPYRNDLSTFSDVGLIFDANRPDDFELLTEDDLINL
jgi:type IV secretion system protein VirD4